MPFSWTRSLTPKLTLWAVHLKFLVDCTGLCRKLVKKNVNFDTLSWKTRHLERSRIPRKKSDNKRPANFSVKYMLSWRLVLECKKTKPAELFQRVITSKISKTLNRSDSVCIRIRDKFPIFPIGVCLLSMRSSVNAPVVRESLCDTR